MAAEKLQQAVLPEDRLDNVQRKLREIAEELAFMEILGRKERIELPRITPLNRPMIDQAVAISNDEYAEPLSVSELERAVDYYEQLEQVRDTLTLLHNKINSTHISLGARIYDRCKDVFEPSPEEKVLEPIFFPLQPKYTPKKRIIHPCRSRYEAIPIANLEGV